MGVGTCPNPSATFAIDLGHPSAGKYWCVRSFVIGGDDITTQPAGVGWVVIQSITPTATVPITSVRDFTKLTLPQTAFYGSFEFKVQQNEHMWVVISGGTAGTQYTAAAWIESFPQFIQRRH